MKGFGIEIKNDLLEPKHIEKMGVAVWLYMWCIDKITRIEDDGLGWVLGGKPITHQDVQEELGIPERTYIRWIKTLKESGYIVTERTPKGLTIKVNKAYKHFNKGYAKSGVSDTPKVAEGYAKSGASLPIQLQRQNSKTTSSVPFQEFWATYPKKVERKKAEAKWNHLTDEQKKSIMLDLPLRKESDSWKRGFILNPMTYLNGERWLDEIPKAPEARFGGTKPGYTPGPASENWTQQRIAKERREAEEAKMREENEDKINQLKGLKEKNPLKSI